MIKGVILDMDGVIVDNRDIHVEAFIEFGHLHGIEITRELVLELFGMGNDEIIPRMVPPEILEKYGLEYLSDEKENIYREIFERTIEPTKGLIPFMADLKAHGVKMSVGSSAPVENVDFVLDKLGIRKYFDAVVHGGMVTKRKPDPEIFLTGAELIGLPPSECLVVEDAFAGIEAAQAAEMAVIALATTFSRKQLADTGYNMIADDFTQLSYEKIKNL